MSSKEKAICIWSIGGHCHGLIQEYDLFSNQIRVKVCLKHYTDHCIIMTLHSDGVDVERIIEMSLEQRAAEMESRGLSLKIDE